MEILFRSRQKTEIEKTKRPNIHGHLVSDMLKSGAPLCIFAWERYPVGGRYASLSRAVDAAWFVCL